PKPVSRMKRPFISELAELGLSGEILSIRTDGMQGTLIPDLTAGVSEAGRVKTGNWVISDKRTFDHVVLCVERQDENHDVYVGKFIQLHVAANKSLKIVEMGDVKLVAITSSIPT
ncbi:HNH endonuclease, partial [Salmonella enterica subsp. enterica serovar Typhimurium]|nr:HNH endonuclease [Salmonella enterica subsp. enterica serovar Typhimurium]